MTPCPWPVGRLLPHAAPMLLLDAVLGYDADRVATAATMRSDHPFATSQGVPVHVGLELMAQTCGAWAGAHALAEGGEPGRMGFLLGSRRYKAARPWFGIGERLEITAQVVFRDQGMGVFDCRIASGGEMLAEAQLSVYQPGEKEGG